jgi:hypothetical protein
VNKFSRALRMNKLLAKKWLPFLLLGIATLLVWGHTVTFDFVWDDTFYIRDLQSVRSLKNIPEMFYRVEAQAAGPFDFQVFRPIRTAHYALLHSLDGHEIPQPWIFHLTNVLWHGGTAMMLFSVLCLLLSRLCPGWPSEKARLWAFLIALGFAVHPVVSEVVCWAKSLDDILATFFVLACLRELLKPLDEKGTRWRALLFFGLAVYSKESAVPFAIFPLIIFHKIHRLSWKDSGYRTITFLLIAMLYMLNRYLIIGRSSQTSPLSGTYVQTLVDMLPVVPNYFRLLWGVPPFFIDYSYMQAGHALWSPEVLGGLVLLMMLVTLGFFSWRKPGWVLTGFGLLWTGLFLLPVSNLLPMMQYMAERFLYLPLIGWLIAAATIAGFVDRKKLIQAATLCVLLLWSLLAWNRSWIWKDELTLFVRSSQEGPKTERVEGNAVAAILHLPHISRFFALDEKNGKLTVRDSVDAASKDKVMHTFEEALRLFPENHAILSFMGITLATTGQPEKAVPLFEKAAQLQPQNIDCWLNLARAALATSQFDKVSQALDKATTLTPNNPSVLAVIFDFQWQTGNYTEARETALRWRQLSPTDENARWLAEVEKKLKEQNPQER